MVYREEWDSIPVVMIDVATRQPVQEFRSLRHASRHLGMVENALKTDHLNPLREKRFEVNGMMVCFRAKKNNQHGTNRFAPGV